MSVDRYTFDTNVLFYALDSDAGSKYRTAQKLVGLADYNRAIILLQSLGELCHSVRKKRTAHIGELERFVQETTAMFEVVPATSQDLFNAIAAAKQHGLPFWDAMLWATSRRSGCSLILTEDFQDGRVLDGVTFRNPFSMSAAELNNLIG